MQNTYQEKIGDLEANNALVRKKLEGGIKFKIKSSFKPNGDQPEAIKKILYNLKNKKASLARGFFIANSNNLKWDYYADARITNRHLPNHPLPL